MARFKDSQGQEWEITIDVVEIRRVREAMGVDLGLLGNILDLDEDVVKFADVLWVLCEEQAKKPGLDRDQFQRRIVGDVIQDAKNAIRNAYLFFCPTWQREAIEKAVEKLRREATNQNEASNGSVGNSAGSAELTPTAAG